MRLVGVALLDQRLRRELRRRLVAAVGGDRREAAERLGQLVVVGQRVQVADQERTAAGARPLAGAEGDDRLARERPQVLLRPEHGAPERVVAERGPVDQVLGHHGGLVVGAGDLLDHDAALAVELLGVDLRAPDEVGQQVDRLGGRLGARGDVEGDEVVRGVGVEHRAHPLGRLVDLAVVVVLLPALEDEVLEEVGHAVLLGTLGAGAGVEGDEDGQGAGAGDLHAVDRQAVGEGGALDRRHSRYVAEGERRGTSTLAWQAKPIAGILPGRKNPAR